MMQTFGMKSLIRTDRAKLNYSQYIERDWLVFREYSYKNWILQVYLTNEIQKPLSFRQSKLQQVLVLIYYSFCQGKRRELAYNLNNFEVSLILNFKWKLSCLEFFQLFSTSCLYKPPTRNKGNYAKIQIQNYEPIIKQHHHLWKSSKWFICYAWNLLNESNRYHYLQKSDLL
jgi:hypothetical protein